MAPNSQPRNVVVNSMIEQAMITDLSPGEYYSFTVIAINDICPSVPSTPVNVTTMEEGVYNYYYNQLCTYVVITCYKKCIQMVMLAADSWYGAPNISDGDSASSLQPII